jgi:hypothetical protein
MHVQSYVSVRLPHIAETSKVAPEVPALIIGPTGTPQMRVLSPEELALFADDDRGGEFEAELINGDWRLIRRARTN